MTHHIDALHHFFAAHSRIRAELLADRLRAQGLSPRVRPVDRSGYYAVTVGAGATLMYARHDRAFVPAATLRARAVESQRLARVNESLNRFESLCA